MLDESLPSRRQRHKVLAVDRDGDIAAVLVASRGKRRTGRLTTYHFVSEGGSWVPVGGGGGETEDPRTPPRSTIPRRSIIHDCTSGCGSGRTAVSASAIRAGEDIARLRWRGRDRTVSPSGFAVVVWRGRRAPGVSGYTATGEMVANLALVETRSISERLPLWVRVRRAVQPSPVDGGWFNYAPRRAPRVASLRVRAERSPAQAASSRWWRRTSRP